MQKRDELKTTKFSAINSAYYQSGVIAALVHEVTPENHLDATIEDEELLNSIVKYVHSTNSMVEAWNAWTEANPMSTRKADNAIVESTADVVNQLIDTISESDEDS